MNHPRILPSISDLVARGVQVSGGSDDADDTPAEPELPGADVEIRTAETLALLEVEQLRSLYAEVDTAIEEALPKLTARTKDRVTELIDYRSRLASMVKDLTEPIDPGQRLDDSGPDDGAAGGDDDSTPVPDTAEGIDDTPPAPDPTTQVAPEPVTAAADGITPSINPDGTDPDGAPSGPRLAPLVASVGSSIAQPGTEIDDDALVAGLADFLGSESTGILKPGRYQKFVDGLPKLGMDPHSNAEILRGYDEPTLAALGCDTPDVFRDVVDTGYDQATPIMSLFSRRFPSSNLQVTIHRDPGIADALDAPGEWDEAARTALDNAEGDADAILAAEKACYPAPCIDPVTIQARIRYACVTSTTEQRWTHPQSVENALAKVRWSYMRQGERFLLEWLRADINETLFYTIDMEDRPAPWVLDQVLLYWRAILEARGLEGGNWTAITQAGAEIGFTTDAMKTCSENRGVTLGSIVNSVVTTPVSPTGLDSYYDGIAVPDPGLANVEATDYVEAPSSFWVALVEPSAWAMFGPSGVELGARQDNVDRRQNLQQELFMEDAVGLFRDAPYPAIWFQFNNVAFDGVRQACAEVPPPAE